MTMRWMTLIAGTVATLALAGCDNEADVRSGAEESREAAEKVQQETGEALEAAAEYFGRTKDRLLEQSREELEELDRRFHAIRDEAVGREDERLNNLRAEVSGRLARAKEKLADLREAGADAWDSELRDFRGAMDDVRAAYRDFARSYGAREGGQETARG